MSISIEFEPEASLELAHAAHWYEERRRSLGVGFLDAVDAAVHRAGQQKFTGLRVTGLADESPVRRLPVPRFPYHVVYVIADDVVRVLAVAHDRQRPNYWSERA